MKEIGTTKLLIIIVGGVLAYSYMGPLGIIMLGIALMLFN